MQDFGLFNSRKNYGRYMGTRLPFSTKTYTHPQIYIAGRAARSHVS